MIDNDETAPESAAASEESPNVEPNPAAGEESSNSMFVWLLLAGLIIAGGLVYVVGSVQRAERDAVQAQDRAEQAIKEYDPEEFSNELPPTESVPLVDGDTTPGPPETPSTTTEAPESSEAIAPEGSHPGVDIDPASIGLAFVNRVAGDDYGLVGYIDRDGVRHQTDLECDRIDLNRSGGICLSLSSGLSGSARGLITNSALVPEKTFGLTRPSRAAVSPDGAVAAWTGFTQGHSYLDEGEFATLTQVISVERERAADLERHFTTWDGGATVQDVDRNYWGVTFVDSDRFYATIATGESTSIVEGQISRSRLDVVFENASCPEVSPDGSTIVAKDMLDESMRLVAIDTSTGERTQLGETRFVDDQVEWLDDDTILYALPNEDGTAAQPGFDIWLLDIEPGATPQLLVPFASSPAA